MRSKSRSPTKLQDLLAIPRSETLDLSHQNLVRVPSNKNQQIKKLCLNNNKLSDLMGIETYPQLKQLDLSNNSIKSWKELKRAGRSLQVLNIQSNPLQNQPNYLYNIVLLFPALKKINRMIMNEELRRNTIEQQKGISSKLLNWMVELNRMDQRLTKTFYSQFLRVENMSDYHEAIDVLEIEQQSLNSQLQPLIKFRNQSMFVKTRMVHDLLSRQAEICFESSEREAVEENYFEYLISLITKSNRSIVEFLASEITVNDQKGEKELLGNEALMFKKMYYHFKKHWIQQFVPETDFQRVGDMYENVFPYYPFEEVFVECVYQSFISILESNLKKIEESLGNVERSQPHPSQISLPLSRPSSLPSSLYASSTHEKKLNETKFIGDGGNPSTWISETSLRPIRLQELTIKIQDVNGIYGDYIPFLKTLYEVIHRKSKRKFFRVLSKSITTLKVVARNGNVFPNLERTLLKHLECSFQRIKEKNNQFQMIECHYRNRYLKSLALEGLKHLVYLKYLRLEKLQSLISKKERATRLIKAYSFKRWKLVSSKTLKYIREVKRSLGKREEILDERYKRIVSERLGTKRRNSLLVHSQNQ